MRYVLRCAARRQPHGIAPKFVGLPAGFDHRFGNSVHKPSQDEHCVERRTRYRQLRGIAHIDKHENQKPLPRHDLLTATAYERTGRPRWHQRHHRDVGRRPNLTGQPDRGGIGSQASQEAQLLGPREWQRSGADQADSAQCASTAAAADAGVRNVGPSAGLKHAEADRHSLTPAVRVGDRKARPASLDTCAHQPGEENQQDGAAIEY